MVASRHVKAGGSASPRSAGSKEYAAQPLMNSQSPEDLTKDSLRLSPRKDSSVSLSQPQGTSARDLLRDLTESSLKSKDSRDAARSCLARSHSGKELLKDLSVSPRCNSSKDSGSVLCRSQSGKELGSSAHAVRRQSGIEVPGSSARQLLGPTRRVGLTDRLGLTPNTGTTGSSDKEVSAHPC